MLLRAVYCLWCGEGVEWVIAQQVRPHQTFSLCFCLFLDVLIGPGTAAGMRAL